MLTGRLTDADGRRVLLAQDLAVTTREADERLRRLLRRIDAFAERSGIATETGPAEPAGAVQAHGGLAELDLLRAKLRRPLQPDIAGRLQSHMMGDRDQLVAAGQGRYQSYW